MLGCAHLDLRAETIAVRYTEGLVHGFLSLRTLDGRSVADGDLQQVERAGVVTARVTFRFRDGSIQDETGSSPSASASGSCAITCRKGPAFPHAGAVDRCHDGQWTTTRR
jgi:hypothetical protein